MATLKLSNDQIQTLALTLLRADTEDEVIAILKRAGLWDDRSLWRLYGDKEGNFAQAGNQQALPEAALVEKIVNCGDSRLMLECLIRKIDPESSAAPVSVRDAVAMFFEDRRATEDEAGTLANWSSQKRTAESHFITLAATGDRPTRGKKSKHMCLTIADQAEGQSALRLPQTILSLNKKNKQRIRFVQGKFNMGGSGALRFCGDSGLQLIISRRNPSLAADELPNDPTAKDWAITVVRREEPSSRSGEPVHSEFAYLAPIGADKNHRHGSVLHFKAEQLPLMPDADEAYKRNIAWGTAIKLYEYETSVGQSNVLYPDGLLYALERLLPAIALPIRVHECRGYSGKKGSFDTTISGLLVRLEDGKGDNLEPGFPLTSQLQVAGQKMTARIYAFKEDKAQTYLNDEGVIFSINGQSHGYLPKSLFARPKAVGLPRLKDSLFVLVDCSDLSVKRREDLFMSSRDRLSKKPIRYQLEEEIEDMLKSNKELSRLQQERRENELKSRLDDDRPLEEVLSKILSASPTLRTLFLKGLRLPRPFAGGHGGDGTGQDGTKKGKKSYEGKRHPTYFRVPGTKPSDVYRRNCELGRRVRIKLETDVENGYFDRPTDKGTFDLEIVDSSREVSIDPSNNLTLEDGEAHLNITLPSEIEVGDEITLQASVSDSTLLEPLVSLIRLSVGEKQEHPPGGKKKPKEKHEGGSGTEGSGSGGITLPTPIEVKEGDELWIKYSFNANTAWHVISDPITVEGKSVLDHTFYINVDNAALKTEMKYSKQDARLLLAKFKYANVLLGLAMLHEAETKGRLAANGNSDVDEDEDPSAKKTNGHQSVQDTIRAVSSSVAPVLIPMIDQLSGITEEQLEAYSVIGEDG